MTLDQLLAETIFQLRQTALHGRLIHAKCLRRGQHAAGAREREEMLKIVPIEHALSMQSCQVARQLCDCRNRCVGATLASPSGDWAERLRPLEGRMPTNLREKPAFRADTGPSKRLVDAVSLIEAARELAPKIEAARQTLNVTGRFLVLSSTQ